MSGGFSGSVVEYPQRGPYGKPSYRGNTTGLIVEQFLHTYHDPDELFFDPCEGSGTSGDVARALGIRYRGFDLKDGFDSTRDDLLDALGEPAGSSFCHPPYGGLIAYSQDVWGSEQHEADLSVRDVDEFLERLQAMLQNVYRALKPGGHYGLLLGNWRRNGRFSPLPALSTRVAPGEMVDEIVKVQNNVSSSRRPYAGSFVPIRHEILHVYRRSQDGSIFAITSDVLSKLERLHTATWRNLVAGAFRSGEAVTLQQLYERLAGHPKTAANQNWQAKVRQIVQNEDSFERLARGQYRRVA